MPLEQSNVDLAVWTWRCWRGCVPSGGSGGVLSRGRCPVNLWAQQPLQPHCGSYPHVSFTSCDSPDSLSDFWGPLGLHCTLNSNPEGLLSLTTSTQVPFAMWVNSHRFWGFGPGRFLGGRKLLITLLFLHNLRENYFKELRSTFTTAQSIITY